MNTSNWSKKTNDKEMLIHSVPFGSYKGAANFPIPNSPYNRQNKKEKV